LNQLSLTLSIIIVSFNTKEKLHRCLSCLDLNRYEVIVVDNASNDGSPQMVHDQFPRVKLILSSENLGFGKANNLGMDQASGQLFLFLNSDAYAQSDAIERLVAVFENEKVVGAGPKLLNMDGSLQQSVAGPLTLWSVYYEQFYLDSLARRFGKGYWRTQLLPVDLPSSVDQVMGACLLVRASCGERFDERFFMYCEDTELCARLVTHGKILYVPSAEVVHELGSSSETNRWLAVARYNLGKELYFHIRHGYIARQMCWNFNRQGAFLRLVAGCLLFFTPLGRSKAKIFSKVLFAKTSELNPLEHTPQ
jgi:N-acetylglucosaminyl-diphospho-decaprenol L-rhamnosyltransferase